MPYYPPANTGNMNTNVYDTDNDNIVDNSETLGGNLPTYYEPTGNKSTATGLGTSNVLYPTQNAVKTYVDNQIAALPPPTASTQRTFAYFVS